MVLPGRATCRGGRRPGHGRGLPGGGQPPRPYQVKQAHAWYAILGDMDDRLHDRFGNLAMTVELSGLLAAASQRPGALLSPPWWMNPASPGPTLENTAEAGLRRVGDRRRPGVAQRRHAHGGHGELDHLGAHARQR